MILTLFGPPGSGKGTQAGALCRRYGLIHVATGDVLRAEIRTGSETGKRASELMSRGEFVPDDLVLGIVRDRIDAALDCGKGVLLDGYPRNPDQVADLDSLLVGRGRRLDMALVLEIDDAKLISRLTGRRICGECNRVYNVNTNPPSEPGVCDDCGGRLEQRADDREEAIATRLEEYHGQTRPVLAVLEARDAVVRIDADRPIDAVRRDLARAVAEARA